MKPFYVLLIGAAVWGITLGIAFIGGIIVGSGQPDAEANVAPISAPAQVAPGEGTSLDAADREQLRQRIQSGEATPEEIQRMRQQFRQGQGGGQGQRGQFNGPGGGGQGPGANATPTP